MPNFVKLPCQVKKVSIQGHEFDLTVCMAALFATVVRHRRFRERSFFGEKDVASETEGLLRLYTDRRHG